jgi:hypothetical protein
MAPSTWVFDPQSGGNKIPAGKQQRIRQRILQHAEQHYAGRYLCIDVRFRGQFCYIDAFVEPQVSDDFNEQLLGVSRQEHIERIRGTPMHLCRLRYFSDNRWSMAFYTYSNEKYEPCVFNDGDWFGTVEQAFDASSVYLTA